MVEMSRETDSKGNSAREILTVGMRRCLKIDTHNGRRGLLRICNGLKRMYILITGTVNIY